MRTNYLLITVISIIFNQCILNANYISLTNPKKNWGAFFKKISPVCNLNTFIESGTYLGDTSSIAAGHFLSVHTIELLTEFFEKAKERFINTPNVFLHLGNSAEILPKLLPELQQKNCSILFWLDGHQMTAIGVDQSVEMTPIIGELESIIQANLSHSMILIDDSRLFGTFLNNKRISSAGNHHYPLIQDICSMLVQNGYSYIIYGDMILAHQKTLDISFSPLLKACTLSRLFDGNNYSTQEILHAEKIIGEATEEEQESLIELYIDFSRPWRKWQNKSPHYNLWMGLILKKQQKYIEACEQFEEVLALGYDHWRIYWYLAESLYNTNFFNKATDILKIVLEKNPNFYPAKELLNNLELKNNKTKSRKYVIGPWPGGLGVCIHSVLNQLAYCDANNFTPVIYWDNKSLYYNNGGFNSRSNVWEYYFEPVSNLQFQKGDYINIYYPAELTKFTYVAMNQNMRNEAYKLINKYFKLNPIVQQKVDQFYSQKMLDKKTIGIHLRGTDKVTEEVPVSPERMIEAALQLADENTQFLLATDEQRLLNRMIELLQGRNVIFYDCFRSQDGKPLHVHRKASFAQVGEDVLVEMTLLSKCQGFVHTRSNVSAVVLYFNPSLKNVVIA